MREVAIAGIGLVKFGRYDGQKGRPYKEIYELGTEAIIKALNMLIWSGRTYRWLTVLACLEGWLFLTSVLHG